MKKFLSLIFLCFALHGFSQDVKEQMDDRAGYFTFCSKKYLITAECDPGRKKENHVCSDQVSMSWKYYKTEKEAKIDFESQAARLEEDVKNFRKEFTNVLMLDKEVNAFKISFDAQDGSRQYRILCYGNVNGQMVLVELNAAKELLRNKDIPASLRQIVSLTN